MPWMELRFVLIESSICKTSCISAPAERVNTVRIPQRKRGITGRVHTVVKRAAAPRTVVIRTSVLTDQVPDNRLCSGPFFGVHDAAAVAVSIGYAILGTGVAAGQSQRNAALDSGGQVVPASAGALHIVAAVVRANAGLDAVGQRAVDVFGVIQGTATS